MTMSKPSFISSLAGQKCPKCRKGQVFSSPLYKLHRFWKMNETCSCCNLRFEVEPGFFFGAMYFTYAFNVAVFIVVGLLLYLAFEDPELWVYMSVIPAVIILLLPFAFRYSRLLFLYLFGGIKYDAAHKDRLS
ncbi:MAG: DUF983 domain-containing protein [Cytophagales bacterium]|nr:DUF983 domain-containing protein [Cytophagales bacterium]